MFTVLMLVCGLLLVTVTHTYPTSKHNRQMILNVLGELLTEGLEPEEDLDDKHNR